METFKEWREGKAEQGLVLPHDQYRKEAWNHQQEKIEKLEKALEITQHVVKSLEKDVAASKEREGKLDAIRDFYKSHDNWGYIPVGETVTFEGCYFILSDDNGGKKAREILKELEGE